MATGAFSNRQTIEREVLVSNGCETRHCRVLVDADSWPADRVPREIGGFLDLPRSEIIPLASADRLVLTLREGGEPYRMILDPGTGRFIARQM